MIDSSPLTPSIRQALKASFRVVLKPDRYTLELLGLFLIYVGLSCALSLLAPSIWWLFLVIGFFPMESMATLFIRRSVLGEITYNFLLPLKRAYFWASFVAEIVAFILTFIASLPITLGLTVLSGLACYLLGIDFFQYYEHSLGDLMNFYGNSPIIIFSFSQIVGFIFDSMIYSRFLLMPTAVACGHGFNISHAWHQTKGYTLKLLAFYLTFLVIGIFFLALVGGLLFGAYLALNEWFSAHGIRLETLWTVLGHGGLFLVALGSVMSSVGLSHFYKALLASKTANTTDS